MKFNNKDKKRQIFLSQLMLILWVLAALAALGIGIFDYKQNGSENTWQFFLCFAISTLMCIYRFAILKRNKKID